jgi:hypothetical protein
MLKRLLHAPTRVHGRSSFGAFVDKNCSVMLNGQKCLVLIRHHTRASPPISSYAVLRLKLRRTKCRVRLTRRAIN